MPGCDFLGDRGADRTTAVKEAADGALVEKEVEETVLELGLVEAEVKGRNGRGRWCR